MVIISLVIGSILYIFVGYVFGIGPLVEVKTVETCRKCADLEMGTVRNGARYETVGGATTTSDDHYDSVRGASGINGLPKYSSSP